MFFNAHAHHSLQKNHGVADPMRIFGALLADSALTSTISWTDLHDKKTIQAFTEKLPQADAQLGIGLTDHYDLDLRSHDAYEGGAGYAFSHQTPKLRDLAARACGLASAEQARGLAHNFIEMGVDINLIQNDSSIQDKVHQALNAVAIDPIAQHLADFFKTNAAETKSRLIAYRNVITRYDLRKLASWTALWGEIVLLLLGNKTNNQATKEALLLAIELTANDYTQAIAA